MRYLVPSCALVGGSVRAGGWAGEFVLRNLLFWALEYRTATPPSLPPLREPPLAPLVLATQRTTATSQSSDVRVWVFCLIAALHFSFFFSCSSFLGHLSRGVSGDVVVDGR